MTARLGYWRDRSREIIARVMRDYAHAGDGALARALFEAYPFGPRKHHPYKVWLDEIKVQRGLRVLGERRSPTSADPRQLELFGGAH